MTPYAYPSSRKPFRAEINSTVPNPLLRTSSATPMGPKNREPLHRNRQNQESSSPVWQYNRKWAGGQTRLSPHLPTWEKNSGQPSQLPNDVRKHPDGESKTFPLQPPQVFFNIGQIIQPHQHIHHNPGTVSQLSAVANKKNWTNPSFNLRLRRTTNNEL